MGYDSGGEQDQGGSDAKAEAGAAGERVAGGVDEVGAERRVRDVPGRPWRCGGGPAVQVMGIPDGRAHLTDPVVSRG